MACLFGSLFTLCLGCTGYVLDNRTKIIPDKTTATARCTFTRQECDAQSVTSDGVYGCAHYAAPVQFVAHACFDPLVGSFPGNAQTACFTAYCTPLSAFNNNCTLDSVALESTFPTTACGRRGGPDPTTTPDAVSCEIRGRDCTTINDPATGQPICDPLNAVIETVSTCFNPVTTSALLACSGADSALLSDPKIRLTSIVANGCVPATPPPATTDLRYSLAAAPLAQASFLVQNLALNQKGGFARVARECDDANPNLCSVSTLASLRILGNDFVASGVPVKNPEIRLIKPATILGDIIEEGDLEMQILATIGASESPTTFSFRNKNAVSIHATATSFNIQGSVSLVAKGPAGQPMPVSFSLSSSGTPAPALNCDAVTQKQRRFGFEDAGLWTSSQAALSTITSPRTEGCFAMGVTGSGYMTIESRPFPASDVGGQPAHLSVDLFIPTGQPNPSWLGALQSYLECPSANVFNAYIGQVELTNRPVGQFSALTYTLPQNVRDTLAGNWNDCSLKLALNVNQTGHVWVLDNLRFSN